MLFDSLSVSRTIIPASRCVKNLDVINDEELTLSHYITYICKSCYHYLMNIHTFWPYLTTSSTETIVHSVISAKLDYCNSLFISRQPPRQRRSCGYHLFIYMYVVYKKDNKYKLILRLFTVAVKRV